MNKNKEYELLTQKIFQNILNHEGVKNIEVKHNVILKGLKGQHQIDVYWRYKLAGIEYQTAIECKNYGSPVEYNDIRAFESALNDIQNINGIFVAKTGYQSGAIEYATNSKIKILELREQSDGDWITNEKDENGDLIPLISNVTITGQLISPPRDLKIEFEWDMKWLKENTSLRKGDEFTVHLSGDTQIIDGRNNVINTIDYYYRQLERKPLNAVITKNIEFEDAYIIINDNIKAKFNKLSFTYKITESIVKTVINATDYISHVLKNIETGQWDFIDINGRIRGENYKK